MRVPGARPNAKENAGSQASCTLPCWRPSRGAAEVHSKTPSSIHARPKGTTKRMRSFCLFAPNRSRAETAQEHGRGPARPAGEAGEGVRRRGLACQGEGGDRQDNHQEDAEDDDLFPASCGGPWPSSAPVLSFECVCHGPTLRARTCRRPRIAYLSFKRSATGPGEAWGQTRPLPGYRRAFRSPDR